jgi:hypothetical protein
LRISVPESDSGANSARKFNGLHQNSLTPPSREFLQAEQGIFIREQGICREFLETSRVDRSGTNPVVEIDGGDASAQQHESDRITGRHAGGKHDQSV